MQTFLHVGCGTLNKSHLRGFNNDAWKELRFDIDLNVHPDIVGTLTDMSMIESGSFDAIYSAFNLDHIYPHQVPIALREFFRVLKDDGLVIIRCPDIQSVSEAIVEDKLLEVLYESPSGPISPIDIMYGNRKEIVDGNEFMAKKSGFTYSSLDRLLFEAGFKTRVGGKRPEVWELFLVAFKEEKSEEEIEKIAIPLIPKPQRAD